MSDKDTILIEEKENYPRKKEAYSTLTITIRPHDPNVQMSEEVKKGASLKLSMPLVEEVKGPFDEKGNLVSKIEVGKTYIFKATKFKKSMFSPIKNIWWAEQIDDGEIKDLEYKKDVNPYLDEQGNVCYKYTAKECKKVRIYAYMAKPIKEVSVECIVKKEKFPKLIVQSRYRKGKSPKGNLANDLFYDDYGNGFNRDEIKRKILKDLERQGESISGREDDLEERLDELIKLNKKNLSKDKLIQIMLNSSLLKVGTLSIPIYKHFCYQKVKGYKTVQVEDNETTYSFEVVKATEALLNEMKSTSELKNFVKNTKYHIKNAIQKELDKSNNLDSLEISDNSTGIIYPNFIGGNNEVKRISFGDTNFSLVLYMHTVWAYEIYLMNFDYNKKEGTLRYYLYDHFGLDANDIIEHNRDIFIAWFILQHFYGVKPFINEVCFDEKIVL